jgi:hypothetical protein
VITRQPRASFSIVSHAWEGREEDEVKQSQLVIDCHDQGIVVNWNFVCLAGMLQCLPSERLSETAAQSHIHKEPIIWNSSM